MLRATAGSRLYIGATPFTSYGLDMMPDLEGVAWTEISAVEALGRLGAEWQAEEIPGMLHPDYSTFVKFGEAPATMQVVMGMEDEDPGQQRLLQAAEDQSAAYPFRLDFSGPSLQPRRRWLALVLSCNEVFDEANSVMRRASDLLIVSPIIRT